MVRLFAINALIVCGYSPFLEEPIKAYLDKVIAYCEKHRPDVVLLSGGITRHPSRYPAGTTAWSEAQMMYEYILPKLSFKPRILRDDVPTMTFDNIEGAQQHLAVLITPETRISVFCETSKTVAVDMLIRHFFRRTPKVETDSWGMESPTRQIVMDVYLWACTWPGIGASLAALLRWVNKRRLSRM